MRDMKNGGWMKGLTWMTLAGVATLAGAQGFSAEERAKTQAFWGAPERYESKPVDAQKGPYQVRLTTQGSLWLWALDRKRGIGKGQTPSSLNPDWDAWIAAKVAHDRWSAQLAANRLNGTLGFPETPAGAAPGAPGPLPEDLYFLVGEAPVMATAVQPRSHRIEFGPSEVYTLQDNPSLAATNRYYRNAKGVRHFGSQVKSLPTSEVDSLFRDAGISASERRIFGAVSLLEGGFDSVNTYDTGFVSVGFIQFACLAKGTGSLGAVMDDYKSSDPAGFARDFKRFGLEVDKGCLVALDLMTGETKKGLDAALEIMEDPRLAAVFHRAGQVSKGWKVAQLKVARKQYFPSADTVTVSLGGKDRTLKVSSFVQSEAGLATLMDRKVHTGGLGNLGAIASNVAEQNGLDSVDQLAAFEAEVIRQLKHRRNFLEDDSLGQPSPVRSKAKLNAKRNRAKE